MSDANEKLDVSDGPAGSRPKGSPSLRAHYEFFAPTCEAILASGISQEELYADIDEAIAEVRAEQRSRADEAKHAEAGPD